MKYIFDPGGSLGDSSNPSRRFNLNDSNQNGGTLKSSYAAGVANWNDAPGTGVSFSETTNSSEANWLVTTAWPKITITYQTTDGTKNLPIDVSNLPSGTVGTTLFLPDWVNGAPAPENGAKYVVTMINTRAEVNSQTFAYDTGQQSIAYAMEQVAAHETGHGFRLANDSTTGRLMSAWTGQNAAGTSLPTNCDKIRVQETGNYALSCVGGTGMPQPNRSCTCNTTLNLWECACPSPEPDCEAEDFEPECVNGQWQPCEFPDDDLDGYSPLDWQDWDCNDNDPAYHPGAWNPACGWPSEAPYPGEDMDCNGYYDLDEDWCHPSPIILDLDGNGFRFTSAAEGVLFDLAVSGARQQVAWTAPGSDDAWLALDRNGNARIDDGSELFGNFTLQPESTRIRPNGFLALAVFDSPAEGGNGDGWIDAQDLMFGQLRLWGDANHDGVSQAAELRTLAGAGIKRLSLDYRESRRRDRWGNIFLFASRVIDARHRDVGPIAYDVYLMTGPPR